MRKRTENIKKDCGDNLRKAMERDRMKERSKWSEAWAVSRFFSKWARSGKDRGMEEGHRFAVLKAIEKIDLPATFTFLDIGCGNGWLVRYLASIRNYDMGVGIDISGEMIEKSKQQTRLPRIRYVHTDLLSWVTDYKFNFIVSMETFYYVNPMERLFRKTGEIMMHGGILVVGTDYYTENPGSAGWGQELGLNLDRRSAPEWKKLFEKAGFRRVGQERILYPDADGVPDWKKKYGSLFTWGNFYQKNDLKI